MIGRRAVSAGVTVAAAVGLAFAVGARGCSREEDRSPVAAVRAFVTAARAGDEAAVLEMLAPASRARVVEAAQAAGDLAGGMRRYGPLEVFDATEGGYAPTDVVARAAAGDRVTVDVLGPNGHRDAVETVRVDGRWRIELSFKP